MSRIGKQPVASPPASRSASPTARSAWRAPRAKLELAFHRNMKVELDEKAKVIKVTRPDDERQNRALHGLTRSLIANMVEGVTKGYEKPLKIEGIGYQAAHGQEGARADGRLRQRGQARPPEGVTVELPDPTTIVVKGADKQKVGQFAAEVRHVRPPEPYKGKGIRYENEQVRRKEGKSFTSGG